MCEFKKKLDGVAEEKTKQTVTTIEGGNVADQPELGKGTEYFERALELTTFGKFNYLLIFICGLILANVLLETLAISFVLPVSQCDINLSIQERGIMSAIGFAGIIVSSHLWGFLADTTGRRKVIRPTLLSGFIITFFSSFSNDFWTFVFLRFLNGVCISGGSATVYAYLGEFHTQKYRSRAIMGAAFIFGLGAMLMPAIAWLCINQEWRLALPFLDITYKPWRLFMVICGIPGLICGVSLFKIPESPKYYLSEGQEDKCLQVLKDVYHMNTGKPKESYPISHVVEDLDANINPRAVVDNSNGSAISVLLKLMWSQTQPLFNREYIRNTLLICFIQFSIFFTSNGMYMWFPHILNSLAEFMSEHPGNRTYLCKVVYEKLEVLNLDIAYSNKTNGVIEECNETLEISTYQHSLVLEVLYAVGFALIGGIINTISKRFILFFCLFACGACGIATVYVNLPMVAIYLYISLLLCGLAINVLSASTVDLYPTRLRAMAVCISLMMGRLGSVVGANVVGALITNYCETSFLLSSSLLIIAGFTGFLIIKNKNVIANQGSSRRTSLVSMTGN